MLELELMNQGQTKWVLPVGLAPRKNSTLQFSFLYRKLNALAMRDSYPILCLNEYSDLLVDATIFLTLDKNSSYLELEIAK